MARVVNEERLARWMEVYERRLEECVRTMPERYCWPVEDTPKVAQKMRDALVRGSYHHVGDAFRRTCKELELKYTRTAIEGFICGDTGKGC